MKRSSIAIAALFTVLLAHAGYAQSVVAPSTATFTHSDADLGITATYQVALFQCATVTTAGTCTGKAAAPFTTISVPKAVVTGTAAARVINLKAAPATGTLTGLPAGVGFVMEVSAVGDTSIPGVAGTSAPSNDSNPLFGSARTPAAPGSVTVTP